MADLTYADYQRLLKGKFPAGESVDVPEYLEDHGNPEAAKKWREEHEKNKDKFKTAGAEELVMHLSTRGKRYEIKVFHDPLDDTFDAVSYTSGRSTGRANNYSHRSMVKWLNDTVSGARDIDGINYKVIEQDRDVLGLRFADDKTASADELLKDMQKALGYLRRRPTRRNELVTIQTLAVDVQSNGMSSRQQRAKSDEIVEEAVGIFNAKRAADETDAEGKFEKGKPADPTKDMSPEDKKKWEDQNEAHKDQFKGAGSSILVGDRFKDRDGVIWVVSEPDRGGTVHAYPKSRGERFAQPFDVADLLKRYTKLAERGASTPGEMEEAEADQDSARADEDRAQAERERADAEMSKGATDMARHRLTWGPKTAGSGSANAKYLDSLPPRQKDKILKAVAKHYDVSVREIEGELKDRDAEDLYEYLAFDNGMAMQVYRDFKSRGLTAADKIAGRAPGGLYGYTKATQHDVEASVRKLQRRATKIAKGVWARDQRVASFLTTHARRAKSVPARLLLAALKDLGPKVASQTRLALDADQERLYDALMMIAENDGDAYRANDSRAAVERAYSSYRKSRDEGLRADFRAVKKVLVKDLGKKWEASHKTAGKFDKVKALILDYAEAGRPFTLQDVYEDRSGPADLDLYKAFKELVDSRILKGPDPYKASGNHGDWVYTKTGRALSPGATEAGRFGEVPLGEVYRKGREWVAEIQWPGGAVDRASFSDANPASWEWMVEEHRVKDAEGAAKQWVMNYRSGNKDMQFGKGFEKAYLPGPFSRRAGHKGTSEFGLYGFKSKTARLGLDACTEMRTASGRVAYDLHRRRLAKYDRITAFLKEHSKAAKCRYSRLLLSSYPDRPADLVMASEEPKEAETEAEKTNKKASSPTSVSDWLAWD